MLTQTIISYLNSVPLTKTIISNPYLLSLSILICFYLFSKLAHVVLVKYISRLTKKTQTDIDDKIMEKTNKPISLLLLTIGGYLAFTPFRDSFPRVDIAENFFSSATIIILTYIIMRIADVLIDSWGRKVAEQTQSKLDDDDVLPLFHRFSKIAIIIIGIMFILPVWGIQIGPLLASLGIAGIAVAFALQTTLGNIFGGASLIIDKAIKVGDVVELDGGVLGTVTDVGLRSTRIRSYNNEMIIMPNGKLADSKIVNFLQPDPRIKGIVKVGVAYGTDLSKARQVILDVAKKMDTIMEDPETTVEVGSLGEFAVELRVLFWVNHFNDRNPTQWKLYESIYNAFNANGIQMPFPTRTVYLKQDQNH